MKFSMFIQPPTLTPRSVTGRPPPAVIRVPRVWSTVLSSINGQGPRPALADLEPRLSAPCEESPERALPVGQRHDGVETRLVPDDSGDMPLAGQIFGEHHVAGPDSRHRAIADL